MRNELKIIRKMSKNIESTYTPTGTGGISVSRNDPLENKVEIIDPSGRVRKEFSNLTDLRDAKDEAGSGEKIKVYKGEYITRNLLKDGVDWHFNDGAVVKNPRDEVGAIFENVGAHGSPSGSVTSNITGQGRFVFRKETNQSGNAIINIGAGSGENSDIYVEAKDMVIPHEEDGQGLLISNGKIEMDIGTYKAPKNNPNTSAVNALVNTSGGGSSTTNSEILINCDVVDFRGSSDHGKIYSGSGDYRGVAEINVGTLKTDTGDGDYMAGINETTSEGYVRLSLDRHTGSADYGVLVFDGSKPTYLEDFEFKNASGAVDSAAVLFYGNFSNVYLKNCVFQDDGFADSIGNYTIGGGDGFGVSSASITVLADVITNGDVDSSEVSVNGGSVTTVSDVSYI